MATGEGMTCFQEKRDVIERLEEVWDPIHRRCREYAEFVLDGRHYEDDDDDTTLSRSSRMVRYTGRQTFHVYEHEMGVVTGAPMSTSARPLDEYGDAELGELAVALLDSETEDPNKEFIETIEDAVGCASVVGYGAARLTFVADEGPWGELMLVPVQPDCLMWDPTVKSVHNRRCRWVVEKYRMTRAEMRAMDKWDQKVVEEMVPSGTRPTTTGRETSATARVGQGNVASGFNDTDEFTVYLVWERKPKGKVKRPQMGSYVALEEQDRYLACTECGHRGAKQMDGPELPEVGGACPRCTEKGVQHPLMRIDAHEVVEQMLAYPDGKLTVLSLDCGVEKCLYEGKWPFKCRSYPYYHIQRYRHPMKTVGPSIASQNWWNQLAFDLHMRIALEREMQSQPYWLLPETGLVDDVGERFEMTDEQGNQMYYEGEAPPKVELIEGAGIPQAWNVMHEALLSGLVAHQGIADLGMGPGQSRDIAARSLEVQVEQQEIPTAHFQRRHQRELSRLLGIYFDAIQDTYPDERVVRLRGADGADAVKRLRAADLPNFDFVVTSAPDFTGLDERKAKGLELLLAVAVEKPWALDVVAKVHRIPPSVVRDLKAALKTQQQAVPAQPIGGAPAPALGGGPAPTGELGGMAASTGPLAPETSQPDASAAVNELLAMLGVKQQQ